MKSIRYRIILGLAIIAVFAGCGTTKPAKLYLLRSSTYEQSAKNTIDPAITIVVGPITVPSYLDRPQMVQRVKNNQLAISEHNRWAQPLAENIMQVVVENLEQLLQTENVFSFTEFNVRELDYQVRIDIIQFDVDSSGETVLKGQWMVYDKKNTLITQQKFKFEQPAGSSDYPAIVSSQNTLLSQLSKDIAAALSSRLNNS